MNVAVFTLHSLQKSNSNHNQQWHCVKVERERVKQVLSDSKGTIWEHLIITGILSYKCVD